jgi:hypothetical protein
MTTDIALMATGFIIGFALAYAMERKTWGDMADEILDERMWASRYQHNWIECRDALDDVWRDVENAVDMGMELSDPQHPFYESWCTYQNTLQLEREQKRAFVKTEERTD